MSIEVVDALHIATEGLLSNNPLTIATQGFIFYIEIGPPVPPPTPTPEFFPLQPAGGGGGGLARIHKKKKRKITVYCIVGDERVEQTVETEKLDIKVSDVRVKVSKIVEGKPVIKILLPGDLDE